MVRLFERHKIRNMFTLDGVWKYAFDSNNVGMEEKWYESFPSDTGDICIPGCWQNELDQIYNEDVCWFMREFETSTDSINMVFGAVQNECDVYIDGNHRAYHYGGFTEFSSLMRDIGKGKHTIVIRVKNTNTDLDTIPLTHVDWFHFGGIIRSIEVHEIEGLWIKDVKVDYDLSDDLKSATLNTYVTLENISGEDMSDNITLTIGEEEYISLSVDVKAQETKVFELDKITLNDIRLWGIFKPELYDVTVKISNDDLTERIGFRKIEAKGKDILLNGEKIFLKGVNRHEEHPDWGHAMPQKLIKRDIDIIKDLGCNAIRGSHYPNSKWTLDYLDSVGMLFWEEIPMWGMREEPLKTPLLWERGLRMHEEMVKRDFHHPCIIFWGLHNEIDTRMEEAREGSIRYINLIKSIDPKHRLLTFATMFDVTDICLDLVDVISCNKYIGWYGYKQPMEEWPEFLNKFKTHLKENGLDNKPFIMSEYGAGGIYGEVRMEAVKWSENFQAEYDAYATKLFMEDPDISGTYIWQYCDIRSSQKLEMGRPRSHNNKGLVNEYRCPKMAYFKIKEIYNEK